MRVSLRVLKRAWYLRRTRRNDVAVCFFLEQSNGDFTSFAHVTRRRDVGAGMGKLLNKYKNGRGLYENSRATATMFAADKERRDAERRRGGAGATSSTGASAISKDRAKKQWKSRGGTKQRAVRALRMSSKGHRALTADEVAKMISSVLQPRRAKYGGQGLAKDSTYVNIASDTFLDDFTELFDEHVDGFNGKSYVKMGKSQEDMLWKQKLREKLNNKKNQGGGGGGGGGDGVKTLSSKEKQSLPKDDALFRIVGKSPKKHKQQQESAVITPKTKVNVDLQAQAIAAYRALKAKKQAFQNVKKR